MTFEEIQSRWDTFLANIESKFHEILKEAEATLPTLLDFTNCDTTIFSNAWQGIYSQAHELIYKIEPTWSDKVDSLFSKGGRQLEIHALEIYNAKVSVEQQKGYSLLHKLEKELHAYKVRTYAVAAHKLLAKGREIVGAKFQCTQCQADLPVQENFFRSYYVTCNYCSTVNTFEPGTISRNIEHFALDALADEVAIQEYNHYFDLDVERRLHYRLPKSVVIDAYRKYAEKFLRQRIEIIPDYRSRYEADLKGKIEFLERHLQ